MIIHDDNDDAGGGMAAVLNWLCSDLHNCKTLISRSRFHFLPPHNRFLRFFHTAEEIQERVAATEIVTRVQPNELRVNEHSYLGLGLALALN